MHKEYRHSKEHGQCEEKVANTWRAPENKCHKKW